MRNPARSVRRVLWYSLCTFLAQNVYVQYLVVLAVHKLVQKRVRSVLKWIWSWGRSLSGLLALGELDGEAEGDFEEHDETGDSDEGGNADYD